MFFSAIFALKNQCRTPICTGFSRHIWQPLARRRRRVIRAQFCPEPIWHHPRVTGIERGEADKPLSLHEQLTEAINDYFQKHGKPPIA